MPVSEDCSSRNVRAAKVEHSEDVVEAQDDGILPVALLHPPDMD